MTTAILSALLCSLFYAIGHALTKLPTVDLDPTEIAFLRSALVQVAAADAGQRQLRPTVDGRLQATVCGSDAPNWVRTSRA